MFKDGQHPATELLLRSLDGELPPRDAKALHRHLQVCWKCRMESDEIAKTVHAYTALSARLTSPERLQPPSRWNGFAPALNRVAEQYRHTPPRHFQLRFAPFFSGRVAFGFQVGLLFFCAALLWMKFSKVPTVSAAELLHRATRHEASISGTPVPGVFQKIRFRMNRRMFTRSTYRDFVHHRRTDNWEVADIDKTDDGLTTKTLRGEVYRCRRAMAAAQFNFDEPLSPGKFQQWLREQRHPHHETVLRSEHRFHLISEIEAGPVHQAELVLRTADYHPIQERLRFANDEELEITEVAYERRPPVHIVAPVQPRPIMRAKKDSFVGARNAGQSRTAGDMEESEMAARLTLRRENADLGEKLTVGTNRGTVIVSGIVETPGRKTELTSALNNVSGIRLQLQTIEEVAEQMPPYEQSKTTTLASAASLQAPLLAAELKARLPSESQRQQYVAQILLLCEGARSHAFALRELAKRYPFDVDIKLRAVPQQELRQLVNEHRTAIQENQEQLRMLLNAFLNADNIDLKDGPVSSPSLWQGQAAVLVAQLQREHDGLVALFATNNAQEHSLEIVRSELNLSVREVTGLVQSQNASPQPNLHRF